LSVTDKTGIVEFASGLIDLGFVVMSTGGTRRVLVDAGLRVQEVSEYTGFPEMMDGRVKTLHPRVHGGILARRELAEDRAAMAAHGIDAVDVVAVNLYPFRETAAKQGVGRDEVVENIDIGGPSMVRSAAKNHAHVAVVVDPEDYPAVLAALAQRGTGPLPTDVGRRLAAKAFAHTAAYDAAIAAWFEPERRAQPDSEAFPAEVSVAGSRVQTLRYGENPHQRAAFYRSDNAAGSLASAVQLCGKELSYNNLLDLDAALGLVREFDAPACVIVKHNNPCGTGLAPTLADAFVGALAGDPQSAFGGIHAYNRPIDAATAAAIRDSGSFVEAILAPGIDEDALALLQAAVGGGNVRVLDLGRAAAVPQPVVRTVLRQVSGGFLLQDADDPAPLDELRVATRRAPDDAEVAALQFAWRVCKHVRSNAIVLATGDGERMSTVGVGAGQMSRVDAVEIAVKKAADRSAGSVLASDAFFPFADGVEAAAKAGVRAVIQPGGSKRDSEVVAAADAAGIAMVFTGRRHFRH